MSSYNIYEESVLWLRREVRRSRVTNGLLHGHNKLPAGARLSLPLRDAKLRVLAPKPPNLMGGRNFGYVGSSKLAAEEPNRALAN
jgi:hypothetical protein